MQQSVFFDENRKEKDFDIEGEQPSFLLETQQFAFSRRSKKKIWDRDGGACVNTKKRHSDGWILHCSHIDHSRDSNYNNPDNGRLLTIEEHIKDHTYRYFEGSRSDEKAMRLLIGSAKKQGLHTKRFYKSFPYMWEQDQLRLGILLDELGLDIDLF